MENKERRTVFSFPVFYNRFIIFLFLCMMSFLLFIAAVSTSRISFDVYKVVKPIEHTFFLKDSVFLNAAAFIFLLLFFLCMRKISFIRKCINRINSDQKLFSRLSICILALIGLWSVFWILIAESKPGADQLIITDIAKQMNEGIYSAFNNDGYLIKYQNQLPITLLLQLIYKVFPDTSFFHLQLLNVFGLLGVYYLLSLLFTDFKRSNAEKICLLSLGLFFPILNYYCIFIYGNIFGLLFSLLAIHFMIQCINHEKLIYGAASLFAMLIAVFLKQNYLIFMIALIITYFIHFFERRRIQLAVLPIMMILMFFITQSGFNQITAKYNKDYKTYGMSTWGWIAMGTSRTTETCDGWFTHDNNILYKECGYNTKLHGEKSKEVVKQNLETYIKHKRQGIRFFLRKNASQWNNPDFQGYWIVLCHDHSRSSTANHLLSSRTINRVDYYLNLGQFCILIGVLLFFLREPCKITNLELYLAITIIGGFIFHTFWEGKSQYIVSYYPLMYFYSVIGFSGTIHYLEKKDFSKNILRDIRSKRFGIIIILLSFMLTAFTVSLSAKNGKTSLEGDEKEFYEHSALFEE